MYQGFTSNYAQIMQNYAKNYAKFFLVNLVADWVYVRIMQIMQYIYKNGVLHNSEFRHKKSARKLAQKLRFSLFSLFSFWCQLVFIFVFCLLRFSLNMSNILMVFSGINQIFPIFFAPANFPSLHSLQINLSVR